MTPVLAKIESLTIMDSLGVSLLGFSIVFFVLISLMVMIVVLRAVIGWIEKLNAAPAPVTAPAPVAEAAPKTAPGMVPAKGSIGEVKLYDVDDKTAALIMAIVASKMDAPLNELRFHSIRAK